MDEFKQVRESIIRSFINFMAAKEQSFDEIIKDIQKRNFKPIYFLMGDEPYFMDKITDLLIKTVLPEEERDFNQMVMYGQDTDLTSVMNAAKRFPMMSEYQLIVIKEAQLLKDAKDIENLSAYVKHPLKSTILVINFKNRKLDGRRALSAAIREHGILFESKKIYDSKIPGFVSSQFKTKGIGIEEKALQMLVDFIGNDLSKYELEVEKLSILAASSKRKRITADDIEQNIGISKDYNNFELIKAISNKDTLKANQIINYFCSNQKNHPIQVTLAMLFNYYSNLLICYYTKDKSDDSLMRTLGLKGAFQLADYKSGLRNYTAMQAYNAIGYIRDCDARIKGFGGGSASQLDIAKELFFRLMH